MEDKNINNDVLNKIYRNAHIALQSISNLIPEVEESPIKKELHEEYEGYEKIIGEISKEMSENGLEPKDINPLKKTMMWSSIKMKTITDNSQNNAADMMVQGSVMGIIELYTILSHYSNSLSENTRELVQKLLDLEEEYERKLKTFL